MIQFTDEEIAAYVDEDHTHAEAAAHFGTSTRTISRRLKRLAEREAAAIVQTAEETRIAEAELAKQEAKQKEFERRMAYRAAWYAQLPPGVHPKYEPGLEYAEDERSWQAWVAMHWKRPDPAPDPLPSPPPPTWPNARKWLRRLRVIARALWGAWCRWRDFWEDVGQSWARWRLQRESVRYGSGNGSAFWGWLGMAFILVLALTLLYVFVENSPLRDLLDQDISSRHLYSMSFVLRFCPFLPSKSTTRPDLEVRNVHLFTRHGGAAEGATGRDTVALLPSS